METGGQWSWVGLEPGMRVRALRRSPRVTPTRACRLRFPSTEDCHAARLRLSGATRAYQDDNSSTYPDPSAAFFSVSQRGPPTPGPGVGCALDVARSISGAQPLRARKDIPTGNANRVLSRSGARTGCAPTSVRGTYRSVRRVRLAAPSTVQEFAATMVVRRGAPYGGS